MKNLQDTFRDDFRDLASFSYWGYDFRVTDLKVTFAKDANWRYFEISTPRENVLRIRSPEFSKVEVKVSLRGSDRNGIDYPITD